MLTRSRPQRVNAVQGLYPLLILLTKVSLFLLYYRVFSLDRRTRLLIHAGIGVNALFYAISFALILSFCSPGPGQNLVQTFAASPHCVVDARILGIIQASFNVVSDVYLLGTPLPIISKLQLSRQKKIGVTAIFMTASLWVESTA